MIKAYTNNTAPPLDAIDVLFAMPIDVTSSSALALVSGIHKYYWVNEAPASSWTASGNYANAVASSCNSPYMNSIIAWNAPISGAYGIEYKPTPYPYSFRPEVQNIASMQSWQLYPNPVTEKVTISCPAVKGITAGFEVENMIGQIVLQGNLESGNQQINLSGIKPGNYVLKLHRADGAGSQQMFVKD